MILHTEGSRMVAGSVCAVETVSFIFMSVEHTVCQRKNIRTHFQVECIWFLGRTLRSLCLSFFTLSLYISLSDTDEKAEKYKAIPSKHIVVFGKAKHDKKEAIVFILHNTCIRLDYCYYHFGSCQHYLVVSIRKDGNFIAAADDISRQTVFLYHSISHIRTHFRISFVLSI